jgi:hypothetical protein
MVNIKNLALGLGITAAASLATIPSVGGFTKMNVDTENTLPTGYYETYDSEEDVSDKKYMTSRDDIFDPDANAADYEAHLKNESANAFDDPVIRDDADTMSFYYKLSNVKYEAKCKGTGIGFGDYLFTEGFSFTDDWSDDGGDCTYTSYTVKCTEDEFKAFLNELTTEKNLSTVSENQYDDSIVCIYQGDEGSCYATYRPNDEILVYESFTR